MTQPAAAGPYVDHATLAAHAAARINIPPADVAARRAQVGHLRERLEQRISEDPDYDLVRAAPAGSVAKGTATRGRTRKDNSDADLAVYVKASAVGSTAPDECGLLDWTRDHLVGVYGTTKSADDFAVSDHAVGVTFHSSGLKVDVVPVVYEGDSDWKGYLIPRSGGRVLTSIPQQLDFVRRRRVRYGPEYTQLIRFVKAWAREQKRLDDRLRFKSFLGELVVAHLAAHGFRGPLDLADHARALEQVFGYIVATGLRDRISFDDCYPTSALPAAGGEPVEVVDPVNPDNNVAHGYTELDRQAIVAAAHDAVDAIAYAAYATSKSAAADAWRRVLGPTFNA